jgi:hypothetical protein
MSWTTPQDVLDRWVGSDAPTDTDLVQALINDAEAVILTEYPRIQERIDDNELPLSSVVMIVSRMVTRLLRNPENLSYWQQNVGPFNQARNYGNGGTDIWLTENEKQMLSPNTTGKAYEVDQGYNATSGFAYREIWEEITDNELY